MAAPFLRKSVTYLYSRDSSFVCKSNAFFSLFFSTDSPKQPLSTLTVSEFLIHSHRFSPIGASEVGSVLNRLKTLDNADSVLTFLKENGFSNAQVERTVKFVPKVLCADVEVIIKPKIRIFQDLGFSAAEVADIISKHPSTLTYSTNKIVSSLSLLKDLLGSDVEAVKFLSSSGLYLSNLEKTLIPNIEFLKNCGVPVERISRLITKDPWFFSHKPENMRKFVEKIDGIGFNKSSGMFVHAIRVVSRMSDETWELKLKTLRELGFTEADIVRVFRTVPFVFSASEKKLKELTEVLLETGKFDMLCIINTPAVFLYSIEKRIKPRLQVLRILEKKNLIEKWPCLGTIHVMSDLKFYRKFVAPYLDEVGEAWRAVSGKGAVIKPLST